VFVKILFDGIGDFVNGVHEGLLYPERSKGDFESLGPRGSRPFTLLLARVDMKTSTKWRPEKVRNDRKRCRSTEISVSPDFADLPRFIKEGERRRVFAVGVEWGRCSRAVIGMS
jgi:hypothetical protein